jgi:polyhydroxyalkanoate synthase
MEGIAMAGTRAKSFDSRSTPPRDHATVRKRGERSQKRRAASPRDPAPDLALESVADAVGGTEDPGAFGLRAALADVAAVLDPLKLTREAALLAAELIRIGAGRSTLNVNPKDPRFRDPAWTNSAIYRRLAQVYSAVCRATDNTLTGGSDGDWRNVERRKLLADIITSSIAPTNTLLGNPAALRRAVETRGRSLVDGAQNLVHDLRHNGGMPSQVDRSQFEVGRNLAVTPGVVVFRNEQLELLQYSPTTPQVYARPVMVMAPQINKYYFLDLAPGRSFVEYAVLQGLTVFMVSWRNPGPAQASWNLDTYVQAILEATTAVLQITGSRDLNAMGFCAGGITMSALLGYLAANGDRRVHSASYAVTLLDFSVPAMIGAFRSRSMLATARYRSRKDGVHRGADLARLFSWVRPNDLVWNYWVNNYLMGKRPPAFDILAWNADSTNLPAGLHLDFLDIFDSNPLTGPGKWRALGSPVDLRKVKIDTFVTGAVNDHLTPWKGCYRATQMLGGSSTFILSHAGHIASLVNPPGNPNASYWTGPEPGPNPDAWLTAATKHTGSWWEPWGRWIGERSGPKRKARRPGSRTYVPLAAAPGTYVHQEPD